MTKGEREDESEAVANSPLLCILIPPSPKLRPLQHPHASSLLIAMIRAATDDVPVARVAYLRSLQDRLMSPKDMLIISYRALAVVDRSLRVGVKHRKQKKFGADRYSMSTSLDPNKTWASGFERISLCSDGVLIFTISRLHQLLFFLILSIN